jgi:hypothetical protein
LIELELLPSPLSQDELFQQKRRSEYTITYTTSAQATHPVCRSIGRMSPWTVHQSSKGPRNQQKGLASRLNSPVIPTGAAHAFLKQHKTTKIIIMINTHSFEEDGAFVWGGTSGSYKGCKLLQIVQDCIPPELF